MNVLRPGILVVVLVALLAACGDAPGARAPAGTPVATEAATEPAASDATRTVDHMLGTSAVPAAPQRIAALDHTIVSNLVSAGVTPGAMPGDSVPWLEAYGEALPSGFDLSAVPTVGENYEPNIERLAALDPDMILAPEWMAEDLYDQLVQVAPTVVFEWVSNGAWQQRFDQELAAIGRGAEAEAVRERYQQVIAGVPEAAKTTTVAFIRPAADGQFRVDSTAEAFPGSVASDAGIPILVPQGVGEVDEGSGFVTLSAELLSVLEDADLIVVADWTMMGEEEPGVAVFERNPLWQQLPAVQAGRVLSVPGPIYNGGNYIAAELLLRAIGEAVTSTATQERHAQ